MTVEGLLQHAQTEVQRQSAKQDSPAPRPATPLGPEWSKDHWKMLDMCFTEERYEVGGGNKMADVDDVEINKVLTRFFELVPEGEWPECVLLFIYPCSFLLMTFFLQRRTGTTRHCHCEEAAWWESCPTPHPPWKQDPYRRAKPFGHSRASTEHGGTGLYSPWS